MPSIPQIYNKELVQQSKAEYNMEDLLRLVSESLGPPGGAQLFEFLDSGNVITLNVRLNHPPPLFVLPGKC